MILYENMKVMVCSPDGDSNYFNIVTGVLQGDTLAPYLCLLSLDYALWISIDLLKVQCFLIKKRKEEDNNAAYADNLMLFTITST